MSKKINYMIGSLLVVIGITLGVLAMTLTNIFTPVKDETTYIDSYNEIDYLFDILKDYSYYYESDEQLLNGALNGIMNSLGDPYSIYFSEKDYEQFNSEMDGALTGIGINVDINGAYPIIVNVINDSPASLSGLKKGQTIISIDDHNLENKTIPEIRNLILGPVGTTRKFVVKEENDESTQTLNITLKQMDHPTVTYEYIVKDRKRIGYLDINLFGNNTYLEFLNAMAYFETKGIDDLIIDIRDNPGGLLNSVTHILDYFINSEAPFMYEKSRKDEKVPLFLETDHHEANFNIAVLMNKNSASASEVFASAMSELAGVPLIGETTFGKGTMQIVVPINPDETRNIKYTTEIWLTPSGEWIHGVGVNPTIEVDMTNFLDISYIDSSQTIEFDHVHKEIKDVQVFLNKLGYDIRSDGYFDIKTKNAVSDYQTKNNLTVTGIVDDETAYFINLEILAYVEDRSKDNQLQAGINYILNHQ